MSEGLRYARWRARGVARAAACAVVLSAAGVAQAHGGRFGPPPPPEAKGPPGGPQMPGHADPGFGGPIVTPAPGGAVNPRPSKRKTPLTPTFETSWQLWWSLNRLTFLPPRGRTATATTGTDALRPSEEGWETARARNVKDRVEPWLRRALAPGADLDEDVVASACIALGKVAQAAGSVSELLRVVEDDGRPDIVRESAALGLGLLRRTRPSQRFKPVQYDIVRGRLLKVFDQYVGDKKKRVPLRTRAFAMFAIGLLGDQPFQPDPVSKDGRLISKVLWQRLGVPYRERELHVAVLHALSLQPRTGMPDGVVAGLRGIVLGKKTHGLAWDAFERAHAVTAYARLGGPSANALLLRLATDARRSAVMRLATYLALCDRAPLLAGAERSAAVRVLKKTFLLEQEILGVGLANIALGRMVGADLAAGSTRVLDFDAADDLLVERAERAPGYLRGFAALGLALAAREGDPSNEVVRRFRARAQTVLLKMMRDGREPSTQGAGVVGLGLLGARGVRPALRATVARAGAHEEVRAHAALALGQIGQATPEVTDVLTDAAAHGADLLRGHAALGLSCLGSRRATAGLLDAMDADASTRRLASVTLALGRLGDLAAVEPLLATADDGGTRPIVRAMAVVSLGRLLDPEVRPSLLALTAGVCYPARTDPLQELLTLL